MPEGPREDDGVLVNSGLIGKAEMQQNRQLQKWELKK